MVRESRSSVLPHRSRQSESASEYSAIACFNVGWDQPLWAQAHHSGVKLHTWWACAAKRRWSHPTSVVRKNASCPTVCCIAWFGVPLLPQLYDGLSDRRVVHGRWVVPDAQPDENFLRDDGSGRLELLPCDQTSIQQGIDPIAATLSAHCSAVAFGLLMRCPPVRPPAAQLG